jgi:CCR4-NOT transcription complex subunit 1
MMPEGQILMCVNDNLDTACSFVEQAAVDRAIPEIDQVIASELEERRRFLTDGVNRDFVSSGTSINRWSTWLPEPYKQTVGGLNDPQRAVYEDFERRVHGTNIGHAQTTSADSTGRQIPDVLQETLAMPNLSTPADQHVMPHQSPLAPQDSRLIASLSQPRLNGLSDNMPPHERISLLIEDVQKAARASEASRLKDLEKNNSIFQDFRQILIVLTASTRPTADLLARQVAEKICSIFANKSPEDSLEAEVLAFLLSKLCQLSELIIRDVLRWMTAHEHLLMHSSNVISALVIVGLMDFNRVDSAISMGLGNREQQSLQLLSDLMDQTLFLDEPQALRADFANSLVAMAQWMKESSDLPVAYEINQKLRAYGMPEFVTVAMTDKTKAKNDQMRYVFDEWVGMYENLQPDAAKTGAFLKDMHKGQIINNTEDLATFLRLSIDSCIESFEREAQSIRGSVDSAFLPTDALSKLIIMMVLFQGETNGAVQMNKAPYLETILSVLVLIVNHHQVMHGVAFHQRAFHRLFSSILYEYSSSKLDASPEHNAMMQAFGTTLKSLQPAWFPGFSFAWMNLIMHRVLVCGMLRPNIEAGVGAYRELIGLSMLYLSQTLRIPNIEPVVSDLYRGILRNMLTLHHDYPEFLCVNYTYLCSRIPYSNPQLRNLVLTSRPAALMDLPDPMTPGLKVERLEEMNKNPELAADFDAILRREKLIEPLDLALSKSSDLEGALKRVKASLQDDAESFIAPTKSVEVLNAVVMYVAQQSISNGVRFDPSSQAVMLLLKLATSLGYQHRYYLANALADQIRYPNTHTDFFCKFILHLWGTNNVTDAQRELREPICRVVYERLAVARPHPWGITILSLEFNQNASYGFWDVVAADGTMHARLQHAMRAGGGPGQGMH